MKKLLMVLMIVCLCACQQKSTYNEAHKLILLLDDILEVMPTDVYE
ncbi:MAG: hypothetical protein LUG12_04175 [Erysipelotrichaceae bacterium]|nr:hypothetical protein [Erysipelotrichaceae bacterium]